MEGNAGCGNAGPRDGAVSPERVGTCSHGGGVSNVMTRQLCGCLDAPQTAECGVGAWSDETTLTADSMKPETPEPPSYIVNLWEQVITVNLTAPRDNGKPITEYQIQGRFDAPIGQTSLGDDLQYDYQVKPEDTPPYEFRARAFTDEGLPSPWSPASAPVLAGDPIAHFEEVQCERERERERDRERDRDREGVG